jgi:hypothetical protein
MLEEETKEEKKTEKQIREEILLDLYAQFPIDEMVKFSELDIQEKLQENPYWIVKFRDLYNKAMAEYEHMETLYDKLAGERYDWYRFESEREIDKHEIKNYYLPKDKKIVQMKQIMARQKVKVDFYKMCLQGMEQQGWRMKSYLDSLRSGI